MLNNKLLQFCKDWMLVIGMVGGAASYLLYHSMPSIHSAGPVLLAAVKIIQPVLLFAMLFLTFCKVEPKQLKPQKWHFWLLLIQGGLYVLTSLFLVFFPGIGSRIGIETAMLCLICPTATACAVVTYKLGGDMAGVLSYTILINLLVSILIPLMVPLTNPAEGLSFISASLRILGKVFPMLIMPCLAAWFVRYCMPRLHKVLLNYTMVSFYIWGVALMLAIAMSTRAIVANGDCLSDLLIIGIASALSCAFQFWAGKAIGGHYNSRITAGQSLGQKNTVFAIWVGYTFMDPILSVAGGFYSIWHNCYNTWQLNRVKKK